VLCGARLLTPVREGSYWVAYGQTQEGQVHGQCDSTHPRCMYPEDLFLDDQLLVHVSSASAVAPGKWFFDYASDKVYMGDDPTGHRVEIGVARRAFAGAATGVTIDGLIIEKYASPAQMGAIGDQYPAANWTVQNSEVRFNHGVGVMAAGGWKVINNKLHHNGQMGFRAEGGSGLVFESNEVAYNNSAGFNAGWEAGAFKVLSSDGAVIRANKSHHNNGPAGWTDIDNINTMVENNEFGPGNAMGYAHEISYAAVIRNNRIFGNGGPGCSWVWAAAIQVQNSSNVEVYGNQIDTRGGCENGIVVIQQNRGSGKFGVYTGQNNYVHDNVVIHGNSVGRNGVAAEYDQASALATNRFDHNTYHVTNLNDAHFVWSYYDWINWNTFKSKGQEITGTADTNLP
jgi:hypothetical protein